jgi:hypothetical protein
MSHLPNNTAAHLRSDVPLCLPLLLLLLLLWLLLPFSAAGSVRSLDGKLAAAGWSAFCTVVILAAALLSHLVSAVLFGCWTADALAGPYTAISQVVLSLRSCVSAAFR